EGVAASLVDMGGRMRLIISEVNCRQTEKPMPMLPVATSYWVPKPDFYTGIEAWLLAGGAHHTAFSYDITSAELATWAEHFGIEAVIIDDKTDIRSFKRDLAMGDVIFGR
ncbi:MAG: L-arabinose isomerase, partial [Parasporobacterium sp.]|nr:L-arabinose isomerase [Parasporobacterium sp.]